MEFFHHAAAETKFVYQEIFEDRVYFRHGISLRAGDTVFDVGANIGLFTLFIKENFKDARVFAFEPSPVIFRILKANTERYGGSVVLSACGIAGKPGEANFVFYPNYSIMSGLHAGNDRDKETLRAGILSKLKEQNVDAAELSERALDRMVKVALGRKEEYVCRLRTLSEIVDEAGLSEIGLLKIDAEGSELDILAGIRADHWPRIRQIVMEIHDPTGTTRNEAADLLKKHRFVCAFEEEKRLCGSGIVNCYAWRL